MTFGPGRYKNTKHAPEKHEVRCRFVRRWGGLYKSRQYRR